MTPRDEIELVRAVERLTLACQEHGILPKPSIPEKEPDVEKAPCTVTDRPTLMSPLGQQPRWSQAGVDITCPHCQKVQHYRINFVGMGWYTVVCCGHKLSIDVRWER
jgi:hypothetical protein